MKELDKEEALEFYTNQTWKKLNEIERAWLQLYQPRLIMPFSEFHRCMEILLDRPVWIHEFIDDTALKIEATSKVKPPFSRVLKTFLKLRNNTR